MAHEERSLTRDELAGLHKVAAVECARHIAAFNRIKEQTNGRPGGSIAEGRAVLDCFHEVHAKVTKGCKGPYDEFAACLLSTSNRFQRCREAQEALRICSYGLDLEINKE